MPPIVQVQSESASTFHFMTPARGASFDFNAYLAAVKGPKDAPTARYSGKGYWIVQRANLACVVAAVQAIGLTVALDDMARTACASGAEEARETNAAIDAAKVDREAEAREAIERANKALALRGHKLFAFQEIGVIALATIEGGKSILLADEMGLGKTVQTVAALRTRAVVICPAVAKGVWEREIKAYRPDLTVTVLSGRGSFRWPSEGEIVVINYDVLPAAPKGKDARGMDVLYSQCAAGEAPEGCDLVADEAHALKNNKAARTLAFRSLRCAVARAKGRTVLLTATPILNRPPELWSLLTSAGLARAAFGSYDRFARLFGARETRWGVEWAGPSAEGSREIGRCLERVMLRRLRADVLDLPRKTWQDVPVPLSAATARACDKFLKELEADGLGIDDVLAGRVSASFERISTIRATLASAKIEAMIGLVEEYEEAEEPLVVFSAHREPIDLFARREGWRVITGDTSAEDRGEIQDLFQAGKLRGVACTIKAGGVAITLTRASHAVFADLEWTPALNAQAEDRILRIGQQRPVTIRRMVAEHPLDQRIADLLLRKQGLINASVEQTSGKIDAPQTAYVEIPNVDLDKAISMVEAEKVERDRKAVEEAETKTRKHNSKRGRYAGAEDSSEPRPARTDREVWAHYAVLTIDAACDGVREHDEAGWSVATRGAGHWLAVELSTTDGRLSDEGWRTAVAVASRHQAQVGRMPDE